MALTDRQKRYLKGSILAGAGIGAALATKGRVPSAIGRMVSAASEGRAQRRFWQGVIQRTNIARESLTMPPRALRSAPRGAMDLRPQRAKGVPERFAVFWQATTGTGRPFGPRLYPQQMKTLGGLGKILRGISGVNETNASRMIEQAREIRNGPHAGFGGVHINYARGRSSTNMRWTPTEAQRKKWKAGNWE